MYISGVRSSEFDSLWHLRRLQERRVNSILSASNKQGDVLAWEVSKEDGPFICPSCKEKVLIKKGRIKIHHFAHIPPTNCAYGVGESEAHRKAKVEIYEALSKHPSVTNLKLERFLGEVRPDISFYFNNTWIAIEVQVSTLSLDTIDRRTRVYAGKGISLLWISPYESGLDEERYGGSSISGPENHAKL